MDLETWRRNNHRPQFVREYREDILEATTDAVADAMPAPDASTHAYRQFLNSHKGTVTRQLGETPTDDPDESGDE